jgi:mRNA interferase MazF
LSSRPEQIIAKAMIREVEGSWAYLQRGAPVAPSLSRGFCETGWGFDVKGETLTQHRSTVTPAPVTSAIRGVPSEVVLNEEDAMKSPCAVNLHNAVTVSQQRLGKRVPQLSSGRMNEVCAALRFSLGCDSH